MKIFKSMFSLMLVMTVIMSMSLVAFAGGEVDTGGTTTSSSWEDWVEKNITSATESSVSGTQAWMRNYLTTNPDNASEESGAATWTTADGTVVYIKKGVTMSQVEQKVTQSINSQKTNENVYNITQGLGLEADTEAAAAMLSGFTPVIELTIGILVTLITLGMTFFSALDIAYIAFPVFRNKCEDAKVNGGNSMMVKQQSNGESKLRWVTDDAQYAINQGSVESGKSPWAIYFGKRIGSYIFLSIILFILMTGNISLLTNIALNFVSGIMNVLSSLA